MYTYKCKNCAKFYSFRHQLCQRVSLYPLSSSLSSSQSKSDWFTRSFLSLVGMISLKSLKQWLQMSKNSPVTAFRRVLSKSESNVSQITQWIVRPYLSINSSWTGHHMPRYGWPEIVASRPLLRLPRGIITPRYTSQLLHQFQSSHQQ